MGRLDLSEYLDEYRDHELIMIIGSPGKIEAKQVTSGICGLALDEVGECPRCRLAANEGAKEFKERERAREALFRERVCLAGLHVG